MQRLIPQGPTEHTRNFTFIPRATRRACLKSSKQGEEGQDPICNFKKKSGRLLAAGPFQVLLSAFDGLHSPLP